MDQPETTAERLQQWRKNLKEAIHILRSTNYFSRYGSLEDSVFIVPLILMTTNWESITIVVYTLGGLGFLGILSLVYQTHLRHQLSASGVDQQLVDGTLDIRQIEGYIPLVNLSVGKDESSLENSLTADLKLFSANLAWYTNHPRAYKFSLWQLFGKGRTWWIVVLFALALIASLLVRNGNYQGVYPTNIILLGGAFGPVG